MKFLIVNVGKTTEEYLKEGIGIYMKRLLNYVAASEIIIPPSKSKENKKAMDDEAVQIMLKILPGDFIVVLDEKGVEKTSRQLASLFDKWMVQGINRVVFITGGAFGVSPKLKEKASLIFSLSKLTFTHQMVRLLLMEQLYRAMTITRNEGYHHD